MNPSVWTWKAEIVDLYVIRLKQALLRTKAVNHRQILRECQQQIDQFLNGHCILHSMVGMM